MPAWTQAATTRQATSGAAKLQQSAYSDGSAAVACRRMQDPGPDAGVFYLRGENRRHGAGYARNTAIVAASQQKNNFDSTPRGVPVFHLKTL
jgi:hypothetical protein